MFTWQQYGPFGGHVFLDFVNTVDDIDKTRNINAVPDWALTLEWSVSVSLLAETEAQELMEATRRPDAAGEHAKLMAFRELAWQALSGIPENKSVDTEKLQQLNHAVQWAMAHSSLGQLEQSLKWMPEADKLGLQVVRARLALAFLDLVTRSDLSRLKECGRCTGLFLDTGRGRGRRWCRMTTCGNREKVARFRSKP